MDDPNLSQDAIRQDPLVVPVGNILTGGTVSMAEQLAEPGNLAIAMTVLANGAAAGANRRTDAADQLSADSQRMWSIAMTTPTVMAGHGMRIASESGSGRTRAETNAPDNTAAQRGT